VSKDALNPGVFAPDGSGLPPHYDHHVDDCGIVDIGPLVPRGVAAGTLALYSILGFPADNVPDPQSKDKLETLYSHERRFVGRQWNTRKLTVGMLEYKRQELLARLDMWLAPASFLLAEAAELQGVLENHTRYVKWARAWFFAIQNSFRAHFDKLFYIAQRRFQRLRACKQAVFASSPTILVETG
jgi:hypothetical protein